MSAMSDFEMDLPVACEQALLFGRAKQAVRGRPPQSRLLSRASRACTFHDIPQMESLLAVAGYKLRPTS